MRFAGYRINEVNSLREYIPWDFRIEIATLTRWLIDGVFLRKCIGISRGQESKKLAVTAKKPLVLCLHCSLKRREW